MKQRYWLVPLTLIATLAFVETTWQILTFVQRVRTLEERVQRVEATALHEWVRCSARTDAVEQRLDQRVDSLESRVHRVVQARVGFP